MASARRNDETLCTDILRFLLSSTNEACEERVVDVYRARSTKCRKCNIRNESDLVEFLKEYPAFSFVRSTRSVFNDRGPDYVAPTTQLTLCPVHSRKSGSCRDRACTGLHFCIFYLLYGQCAFASSNHSGCLFGHDLEADPHNRRLLQQSFLVGLNLTELRRLFCLPGVRRGVTVPKICRYYNKHMGCNKGEKCRALHLCHPYVLKKCKFSRGCRRNHDIDDQQVKKVLLLYGVKFNGRKLTDILTELRRFPGEEDREDAGSWSDDDDGEYCDDRGRSHTRQAPAFRRFMSHNRSSSRAASRNRIGSSSLQDPPEHIRSPVQTRPGRNATEHEMAEESSQASGSDLRNGYSMPPAQPPLDSMTQAESVRNGNASQGVTSRSGSLSSRDKAAKKKKKEKYIKEEKIDDEREKGEKKRKLD